MCIQGQCAFDSHPAKPPPEMVSIQFGPLNQFHKLAHEYKHKHVICCHKKSGNNSVRTKGVNLITKGHQTNIVIVRSIDQLDGRNDGWD